MSKPQIIIFDDLSKRLLWLINRHSMRAALTLAFEPMSCLNSLKPCILYIVSFMFEAVAETYSKCICAHLYGVGAAASYH